MLSNKKLLIPIIAVIMIPILYAGMFLFAFWDPYDHMEDLPIAVVNMDEGAFFEGEHLTIGEELVTKLKEDPAFDFQFVDDEKKAYQDLLDQKYYVLIKIPQDFSEHATTLLDDTPEKLHLIYMPNESFNFLSSQMGETAMLMIESALEENIIETYAETIFDKITEVADGLDEASDGTNELNDGAFDLKDGVHTLANGLEELARKSIDYSAGVKQARTGSSALSDGSRELSSGMDRLSDGSSQLLVASQDIQQGVNDLANGIGDIDNGLQAIGDNIPDLTKGTKQVQDGLTLLQGKLPKQMTQKIGGQLNQSGEKMNEGLNQLKAGIEASLLGENGISGQLIASLPTELPDEFIQEINQAFEETMKGIHAGIDAYQTEVNKNIYDAVGGLEKQIQSAIEQPLNQLQNGLISINDGQLSLQDGVNQLSGGTLKLKEGSNQLAQGQHKYVGQMVLLNDKLTGANLGAMKLSDGATDLTSGMIALEDGADQLSDGSHKLADGSNKLVDGTEILTDGTQELHDKMLEAATEAGKVSTTEKTYNMMADPVKVKNEKINEVPNYGTGFSPYFLSLGLFVGALLLSIVYPLRDPVHTPKHAFNWLMSKSVILIGIGVLQALIASGILLIGLGLEVQSIPLFLLYAAITSLTFITLIQFFVTCFGDPGRFIAILILILQLTTSAGTFPLELIPKSLQIFNTILPMTYTVAGLKAVVSSGDYAVMWQNAGILLGFTVIFIAGSYAYFKIMFKRKYGTLASEKEEEMNISA